MMYIDNLVGDDSDIKNSNIIQQPCYKELTMMLRSSILLITLFYTHSFSKEGQWTAGFGQGNLEYFIDNQGYRLYIGCPTPDGSADAASSVSLYKIDDEKDVAQFTITVNGSTYEAPIEADCRAGEDNFLSLLDDLRKGNAVVKFGKRTITFPKSNAAKIIPSQRTKNFTCNLLWSNPPAAEE